MTHDLIKKLNTARFKSIINIVLFVMLILFLIFVLVRAEKVSAQVCSDEDCEACLSADDCFNTNYCFWNLPFGPCISFIEDEYLIRILEDFEQPVYDLGLLTGQNNWITNWSIVQSEVAYNSDQAIRLRKLISADEAEKIYPLSIYNNGYFSFYFLITDYDETNSMAFTIRGDDLVAYCKITEQSEIFDKRALYCEGNGDWHYVALVPLNTWNKLTIEFDPDNDTIRWRWNDLDFYDWYSSYSDFYYVNMVYFNNAKAVDIDLFIDDIQIGEIACSLENCSACRTAGDCLLTGCYFDYMSGDCLSFGPGICGQYAGLQFCDNQVDCEFFGGNWVADYCFWGEQSPTITPFLEYYASNSNFEAPTGFIIGLANFITPIIETAGGFITSFKDIFDPVVATEKGILFGSAVPVMIGYTGIINNFLGGLPVAEGLLAFIVVVLLISVFRIVVKLVNLIKP